MILDDSTVEPDIQAELNDLVFMSKYGIAIA